MWTYNGRGIRVGRSWTDDSGVKHPTNWSSWSDAEKTAKGLSWVADPAPYDNRFYWSAGVARALEDQDAVDEDGNAILDQDGNQVVTKGLKTQAIERIKAQAAGLLAPSDWYIVRKSETSEAIPADVLTYRQAVRTASNDIEAAIKACSTLGAFIALHNTPVDADGNPTGNAPIADWPDSI